VVIVAIFPEPPHIRPFDLFWRELEMVGIRVYEPAAYERAIELVAQHTLSLERLIGGIEPLANLPTLFDALEHAQGMMKMLVDVAVEV
jgi:threonine dehydrogenase-like Zn-dependent dehydrogenase